MFFFDEQPTLETDRLLIREIRPDDAEAMFAMDSDPEVHRYLGNKPVKTLDESRRMIEQVRGQYASFGIGRWAIEEKATTRCLGWTGFKWMDEPIGGHVDYLDIGYRLVRHAWGRGIASEAGLACMAFAAKSPEMQGAPIAGMVVVGNAASERILNKLGLRYVETFAFEGETVKYLVP
jgi:RimJ/RimL family protein N-acetyltransferase